LPQLRNSVAQLVFGGAGATCKLKAGRNGTYNENQNALNKKTSKTRRFGKSI
jgi:hypothetical protein